MAIAKVVYKENASATPEVWMDTTQKTVTAGTMLSGTTALKNDGAGITGDIASKSSSDLTASGATVTAPAGYYPNAASKAVASGSASTPSTSITANPAISVDATGLITASVSGSKSVTPTVSAGYVTSGTAGAISVSGSNTEQLTTQAATTYHPSTTDQTIAIGKYLTGAQTIKAVTTTNLTAANIAEGVTVKIGDSTDDDCVASVTGTASGSSYTLMATDSVTVETTSTSSTDVKNIEFSATTSRGDVFFVRVTDHAGRRNGYFYQADSWVMRLGASGMNTAGGYTLYTNSSGSAQNINGLYGVCATGYSAYNGTFTIKVVARYNSSVGTVDGTYDIEIYKLDMPT